MGLAVLGDPVGLVEPATPAVGRVQGTLDGVYAPGDRVRRWTTSELSDISDLRAILEGHAAALAAALVTDADLAAMDDLVTRMEALRPPAPSATGYMESMIGQYVKTIRVLELDAAGEEEKGLTHFRAKPWQTQASYHLERGQDGGRPSG